MGNWHAWENLFLRSKISDVSLQNLMAFSVVNNTSVGSKRFLDFSSGHTWGRPVLACSAQGWRDAHAVGLVARTQARPARFERPQDPLHRVSDDDDPLAVSPRKFRQQIGGASGEGFQVVGLAEAVDTSSRSGPRHRRSR